jgi:dolichol-phosphate mannosyltransferase
VQVSGAPVTTPALPATRRWRAAIEGPDGKTSRVVRFGVIGGSGIVINQLFLWLFVDFAALDLLLAAVLASQVSTVWNFVLLERLVFPGRPSGRALAWRFIRYDAVNMSTLVIRAPALVFGVDVLGFNYLVVNFVVLIGLFVVRYALAESWIWRHGGAGLVRAADDIDEAPAAVENV